MSLVLRLALVAIGAVLFLALLCGALLLGLVWGVRRVWARVTGRPVAPWVLRVDPAGLWKQAAAFRKGPARARHATVAEPAQRLRAADDDITDVTPR